MDITELWKAVSDWPDYEISNLGNVRRSGRPIKTFRNNRGYLCFNVSDGPKRKLVRVHREVAKAFVPGSGSLLRHMDGNQLNCRATNLSWGEPKDNEADKRRHDRHLYGERHHQHKLTWDQINEIRSSHEGPFTLARKYNVHRVTIWCIRNNKTWKQP